MMTTKKGIKEATIKITTHNTKGAMNNIEYIKKLTTTSQIIFIQETWLTAGDKTFEQTIKNPMIHIYANEKSQNKKGRPSGGILWIIRNDIRDVIRIEHVSDNISKCFIANGNSEVVIIGVYINCDQRFRHDITELEIEINKHAKDKMLIIGDFNSDINRKRPNDKLLSEFLEKNELKVISHEYVQKIPYTFKSAAHQNKGISRIDHILASWHTKVDVNQININYDSQIMNYLHKNNQIENKIIESLWEPTNNSDHRSITVEINESIKKANQLDMTKKKAKQLENKTQYINWENEKVQEQYSEMINRNLNDKELLKLINEREDMTEAIERLHKIMLKTINDLSNNKPKNETKHKKSRQEWDIELETINNLKVRSYIQYVKTKEKGYLDKHKYYKKLMRAKIRLKRKLVSDGLGTLLQKQYQTNIIKFWRTTKSKQRSDIKTKLETNEIKDHFQKIFNVEIKSDETSQTKARKINENIVKEIKQKNENVEINPEEVQTILEELPKNKAIGHAGISNEMYKYAAMKSNLLANILAKIFSKIINNMIMPSILNISKIIPIVKDEKGDLASANNLRPISISDTIATVFEKLMLNIIKKRIEDEEQQFGFKANSSCNHAIFVMRETIINNLSKNKPTHKLAIDFRRAFDGTNREKLFNKIGSKMKDKIWLALYQYYSVAQAYVVNDEEISSTFTTSTGVKQGGALSPKLYSIYAEELIRKLVMSDCLSKIDNTKTGVIMFADDTIILTDNKEDLEKAIKIVEDYCKEYDIEINAKKSQYMIFGPKKAREEKGTVKINGDEVERVSKMKYLGVYITETLNDKTHLANKQIATQRSSYKIKSVGLQSSKVAGYIKSHMFKVYCRPVMYYGIENLNVNKGDVSKIERNENLIIRRLLNIPMKTHITRIRLALKLERCQQLINLRKCRFVLRLLKNKVCGEILRKQLKTVPKNKSLLKSIYNILNKYKTIFSEDHLKKRIKDYIIL